MELSDISFDDLNDINIIEDNKEELNDIQSNFDNNITIDIKQKDNIYTNKLNNIIKRKTDNESVNILKDEVNKPLNNKNNNVNINSDNEIFELNMLYYKDFIDYLNYKIKSYELTLDDIQENKKDKYDIKSIINYINCLHEIKMTMLDKQQDGFIFKKTYEDLIIKYKDYNIK